MAYAMSGGFKLYNCAKVSFTIFVTPKYPIGSLVYICDEASKNCRLRPVCIKKINLRDDNILNYKDTYNRLWLEHELCTYAEALENIEQCIIKRNESNVQATMNYCKNT